MSNTDILVAIVGSQVTVLGVALIWGYVRVIQTLEKIDRRIVDTV